MKFRLYYGYMFETVIPSSIHSKQPELELNSPYLRRFAPFFSKLVSYPNLIMKIFYSFFFFFNNLPTYLHCFSLILCIPIHSPESSTTVKFEHQSNFYIPFSYKVQLPISFITSWLFWESRLPSSVKGITSARRVTRFDSHLFYTKTFVNYQHRDCSTIFSPNPFTNMSMIGLDRWSGHTCCIYSRLCLETLMFAIWMCQVRILVIRVYCGKQVSFADGFVIFCVNLTR